MAHMNITHMAQKIIYSRLFCGIIIRFDIDFKILLELKAIKIDEELFIAGVEQLPCF